MKLQTTKTSPIRLKLTGSFTSTLPKVQLPYQMWLLETPKQKVKGSKNLTRSVNSCSLDKLDMYNFQAKLKKSFVKVKLKSSPTKMLETRSQQKFNLLLPKSQSKSSASPEKQLPQLFGQGSLQNLIIEKKGRNKLIPRKSEPLFQTNPALLLPQFKKSIIKLEKPTKQLAKSLSQSYNLKSSILATTSPTKTKLKPTLKLSEQQITTKIDLIKPSKPMINLKAVSMFQTEKVISGIKSLSTPIRSPFITSDYQGVVSTQLHMIESQSSQQSINTSQQDQYDTEQAQSSVIENFQSVKYTQQARSNQNSSFKKILQDIKKLRSVQANSRNFGFSESSGPDTPFCDHQTKINLRSHAFLPERGRHDFSQKLLQARSQQTIIPLVLKEPLKLKIDQVKKPDFQDEFMSNYEQFSESWREQIDKNRRF